MHEYDSRNSDVSVSSMISATLGLLLCFCATVVVAVALIPFEMYLLASRIVGAGSHGPRRVQDKSEAAAVLASVEVTDT